MGTHPWQYSSKEHELPMKPGPSCPYGNLTYEVSLSLIALPTYWGKVYLQENHALKSPTRYLHRKIEN